MRRVQIAVNWGSHLHVLLQSVLCWSSHPWLHSSFVFLSTGSKPLPPNLHCWFHQSGFWATSEQWLWLSRGGQEWLRCTEYHVEVALSNLALCCKISLSGAEKCSLQATALEMCHLIQHEADCWNKHNSHLARKCNWSTTSWASKRITIPHCTLC